MRKIASIVLFLFAVCVHAQIGFEKGYFISNDSLKTECFIKNLDWRSSPIVFSYKLALADNEIKTEKIDYVKEFGIDNLSKYERFTAKL